MVSASQIVSRTQTVWGVQTVPYSMVSTNTPTGHRADCSGYASAVLGLATPGLSTVTLVTSGAVKRVGWEELAPGDLLMIGGPGTEGANGHVAVYTGREGVSYVVWEQSGGMWGPHRSLWVKPDRSGYLPYRLANLTPEQAPTTEVDMFRLIDPEGAQFVIQVNPLSPTGFSYVSWGNEVQPQIRILTDSGAIPTVDARSSQNATKDWRPGAFGPKTADVRATFIADVAKAVAAALPAGAVDVKALAAELGKLLPAPPQPGEIAKAVVDEEHNRLAS